ncbi:hypothetical protein PQX77_011580 [Marasmius sp. AFHP31]|nr:hypothetical protein PQX77_011580 [Marasmius sp. AFHP31]
MVSSKPLATRQGRCFPNFQGQAVSIVEGGNKFIVDGVTSFFVQQDGQDPADYIIKDAANTNRAVTASGGNNLDLRPASNSGTEQDQLFEITCASCAPDGNVLAKACTIQAKGQNLCFDAGSNSLQTCDGSNDQSFNISK